MDQERIFILIQKQKDNTASDAERDELLQWYRQTAYQDAEFPGSEDAIGDLMLSRLNKQIKPAEKRIFNKKWLVAASVLLVLGVSSLFILKFTGRSNNGNLTSVQKNDISPGSNKAILILADGSKISLTDAGNGKIATQHGMQITKSANGQLIYAIKASAEVNSGLGSSETSLKNAFNTIETPKGGQYQVILPDGSKVWLNAFSSLKFPVSFDGQKERRVELRGEAYFEVIHNESRPFKVVTGNQIVEDLGTRFNVSAYDDEKSTRTSLLQGKVRVTAVGKTALLVPGQQATITNDIKISEVNTENVIAWKNGYFNFDDEKLENIMRSAARWYDINAVFEDESLKNETFGAVTTRFSNISTLLKMMEQTGDVSFIIEGSTIRISKKSKHR